MKITYDLKQNSFKNINLLLGVFQTKKRLIKNPNKKILKASTIALILLVLTIFSFILFGISVYIKQKSLQDLFYFIFVFKSVNISHFKVQGSIFIDMAFCVVLFCSKYWSRLKHSVKYTDHHLFI